MAERPQPNLDRVRAAMRDHDERAHEDEEERPAAEPDDEGERERDDAEDGA
jgi:hypothetical protein